MKPLHPDIKSHKRVKIAFIGVVGFPPVLMRHVDWDRTPSIKELKQRVHVIVLGHDNFELGVVVKRKEKVKTSADDGLFVLTRI